MVNRIVIERRKAIRSIIERNPRERPGLAVEKFMKLHLYGDKISTKTKLALIRTDIMSIKRDPKKLAILKQCQNLIAQINAIKKIIR